MVLEHLVLIYFVTHLYTYIRVLYLSEIVTGHFGSMCGLRTELEILDLF